MATIAPEKPRDFDWSKPNAIGKGFIESLVALQDDAPTYWSEGHKGWFITRYADVEKGLRDEVRLTANKYEQHFNQHYEGDIHADFPTFTKYTTSWLTNLDSPEHMRLRKLLIKPFAPSAIERYRIIAQAIFDDLVERIGDEPIDFLHDFILDYPAQVILEVVGLKGVATRAQLVEWSHAMIQGAMRPSAENLALAETAMTQVNEILHEQIRIRRADPREDLLTQLIFASDDEGRLSEDEVISLFQIMLNGGFETTALTISLGIHAIDRFPEQRAFMRDNPQLMPQIIDELNRYTAMLSMIHRKARIDHEFNGQQIRAGDIVYLMIGAANWDPGVFERPDQLDFGIKRKPPLTFAPGVHHCLGHALAKMEIDVALKTLFSRFSRIEAVEEELTFLPSLPARTPERVLVRFHRA